MSWHCCCLGNPLKLSFFQQRIEGYVIPQYDFSLSSSQLACVNSAVKCYLSFSLFVIIPAHEWISHQIIILSFITQTENMVSFIHSVISAAAWFAFSVLCLCTGQCKAGISTVSSWCWGGGTHVNLVHANKPANREDKIPAHYSQVVLMATLGTFLIICIINQDGFCH